MFEVLGKEAKITFVPIWIFDTMIQIFSVLSYALRVEFMEDAAESARIARYYATQDLVTTDPSEKVGSTHLMDHFKTLLVKDKQQIEEDTVPLAHRWSSDLYRSVIAFAEKREHSLLWWRVRESFLSLRRDWGTENPKSRERSTSQKSYIE